MKKILLLTGMAFVCLLLSDAPVAAQSIRSTRDLAARSQDNMQDRSPVSRKRSSASVPSRREDPSQNRGQDAGRETRDRSSDRGTWGNDRDDRNDRDDQRRENDNWRKRDNRDNRNDRGACDDQRRENDNWRKRDNRDDRDWGNDRDGRGNRDKKYGGKNKHDDCHHPGKHKGHHKKNHPHQS